MVEGRVFFGAFFFGAVSLKEEGGKKEGGRRGEEKKEKTSQPVQRGLGVFSPSQGFFVGGVINGCEGKKSFG
ncbi:hypothetical protein D6783_05965 [Candidatus Woesearchaeota archaeon]|nr:MAG: hypothetical protein D6783_05965 [Candidatus Woesearchaeota archaeon]